MVSVTYCIVHQMRGGEKETKVTASAKTRQEAEKKVQDMVDEIAGSLIVVEIYLYNVTYA